MNAHKLNQDRIFGPASDCQNLAELLVLQQQVMGDDAQKAIAAYGMVLGSRSAPQGDYRNDALGVLDCVGAAKMELDKSACHTNPVVIVTAAILSETQKFVDDMTIPCTEWPTSGEVVAFIFDRAAEYGCAGPWRRTLLGDHGLVAGVEEFGQA